MESTVKCKHCGKPLTEEQVHRGFKYCSNVCVGHAKSEKSIECVDKSGVFPTRYGGEASRRFVRKYLEHKHGHVCSICGRKEWDGVPIPLVVDHIDGNALNSEVSNFRLVCGNCNMLLDTYGSRNRYGRKWRREFSAKMH